MKKYICAVVLSVLAAGGAVAQTENDFIRTSIVIGVGGNQIDGDEMTGYNKPGFIVGAASRFLISEKLGFQPEVLYLQKGSRTTQEQQDVLQAMIHWKLSYVEIPVLLTYEFYPKFSLFGGAAYSYLLGAKLDNGGGNVNLKDRFKTSDMLWVAGLDYQIWQELSLNMRMERSLTTVTKQAPNFFNNSVAISLRYHLGQ